MANGARKGPNGGGALSSDRPCRRPLAAAAGLWPPPPGKGRRVGGPPRRRAAASAGRRVGTAPRRRGAASARRRVGGAPRRGLGVSSVFQEAREALGGPARIHEHTTKGPRGALELRSTQLSELTRIYLSRWILVDFATILLAFEVRLCNN
jgi:hypothetical protein